MWLASRLEQEQEAERPAVTQDDVFDSWVSLSVTDSRTEKNEMIFFFFFFNHRFFNDFFIFHLLERGRPGREWGDVLRRLVH